MIESDRSSLYSRLPFQNLNLKRKLKKSSSSRMPGEGEERNGVELQHSLRMPPARANGQEPQHSILHSAASEAEDQQASVRPPSKRGLVGSNLDSNIGGQ